MFGLAETGYGEPVHEVGSAAEVNGPVAFLGLFAVVAHPAFNVDFHVSSSTIPS